MFRFLPRLIDGCHCAQLVRRGAIRCAATSGLHRKLPEASYIYDKPNEVWQDMNFKGQAWERGTPLKIISWNIDFSQPAPSTRVSVALDHIQKLHYEQSHRMVIFFQEVCQSSLEQILHTEWVQCHFAITGLQPPAILRNAIPRTAQYFNIILTPGAMVVKQCFRMPLPSEMGRDALFVDIPLAPRKDRLSKKDVLRLCTSHLESLETGVSLRRQQLEMISKELHAEDDQNVIAGLVGGDMNSIYNFEDNWHSEVGLKDAWKEGMALTKTSRLDGQQDYFSGRHSGHTWGYNSTNRYEPKRLDKFMYTGSMEIPSQNTGRRCQEKVERLGIGLKAENL